MIHWKRSEDLGLTAIRVLDARVEPHRDGAVFFVSELVEYSNGERGWRRQKGEGTLGRPYTKKYDSREKVEATIAAIHRDILVREAKAILEDAGEAVHEGDLRRLCFGAGLDKTGDLVRVMLGMNTAIDGVMAALLRLGPEFRPMRHDLKDAFLKGAFSIEALVAWVQSKIDERADEQHRYAEATANIEAATAVLSERSVAPLPTQSDLWHPAFWARGNGIEDLVAIWIRTLADREAKRRSDKLAARKAEERDKRMKRDFAFLVEKPMQQAAAAGIAAPARAELSLASNTAPGTCAMR
jgi:hypothetical protein